MTLKQDILSSEALNLKEKTIIDFITQNPGATKQKVVDALVGKYSRVIIFNTIKDLENSGIIIIQKDRPNTRIHNLYINEHNQILIEINRLTQFEAAMMDLLEEIKKRSISLHSMAAEDTRKLEIAERIKKESKTLGISFHDKEKIKSDLGSQFIKRVNDILKELKHSQAFHDEQMHYGMFFILLRIFWNVLQAYTFKAVFEWPSQVNNKLYSNKLIQSVLNKLIDIQVKIAQIINDVSSIQTKHTEERGYGIGLDDIYKQSLDHLKKEISRLQLPIEEYSNLFRKHGLGKEVEDVMNSVYPITRDLFV